MPGLFYLKGSEIGRKYRYRTIADEPDYLKLISEKCIRMQRFEELDTLLISHLSVAALVPATSSVVYSAGRISCCQDRDLAFGNWRLISGTRPSPRNSEG
jgi:hypothetical protein